jgi:hypothetical protein
VTNPDLQPSTPEGDDVELREVLDPATVRRAPRYAAFLGAGVVVGVLLGLALGLYLLSTFDPARDQPLTKPGVWLTVTVFGMTTVTALLGGALAVVLDRRSLRRWGADNAPRQDDSHAV